ncbi:CBS domain-containing protein [archaeon]|jgi:arsenite transporter|nr:CBS domain-containing protein [archaeon]MBT3465058.1 CBS domain-containing protein [archaeon]MBT6869269.1 CBS domain-containing protein [archaeon]MBT7193667.1 CBS domain-containing protein [archaeon]MBT7381221.1 CBS domain-containing protein [archaeon]
MWIRLSFLQKNLVYAIPISLILGVLFGYLIDSSVLKILILPLTILMIYPMMVTLNIKSLFTYCKPKTQILIQLVNFIIIPLVGFGIGLVFLKNTPYLAYGLLLIALLPTSGMTISWTGFAKGNVNLAIKTTIIGLILGSLLMPFYTAFFVGQTISLPILKTFIELGKVIFLPLLLGFITQIILKKIYGEMHFNKNIKSKFPLLSTLAVIGIIFVAMALKSKSIIADPLEVLYLLIPLILFYIFNYFLTSIIGKYFLSREDAITLVYGSVMRNLSVALAIALIVFGDNGVEIALIIAVAYVIQVQSAAWYIKFSEKVFGVIPEDVIKDIVEEGLFALHNNLTLYDVIKLLDEEHINSVAILNRKEKIVGLITSQIIINLLADNKSLKTKLSDIKLPTPLQINERTPIKKVLSIMKQKHKYKVLVINQKGKISGVLTKSEIISKFAGEIK